MEDKMKVFSFEQPWIEIWVVHHLYAQATDANIC